MSPVPFPVRMAICGALVAAAMIGCSGDGSTTSTAAVTAVTLTPATVSLSPGQTAQLTPAVTATGGAATSVTWTTGNAGIASVNNSGLVTAVAAGSTTIVATSTFDHSKTGSATVTVQPAQHLYVGDDNGTGSLRMYTLPLTSTSTAVAAIPMDKAFTMGASTNTLATTTLDGHLYFFNLPLTSASTPFASFAAGSDGTPIFTSATTLYQGGSGKINVYTSPFTNTSVPSSTITTNGLSPAYLAIDAAGNVYEGTGSNTIGVVSGGTLGTVLTAAAGVQFRGMVADATRLYACGFTATGSFVYIYSLPLSASGTPTTTITLAAGISVEACGLDALGNLYVGETGGKILVYSPPFTNASVPGVTLTTPAIIFGLTVGN